MSARAALRDPNWHDRITNAAHRKVNFFIEGYFGRLFE